MAQDDPEALARRSAEAMYASDSASQALGITVEEVAPGRASVRMTITAAMANGHGIAHGGYMFLLADTAFAFACNTYGTVTVARGAEITFLEPAHLGDELVALATERVRRGRSGIYDVRVTRTDGTVIAEFRGHSHTHPDRPITPDGGTDSPC